MVSPAEEEGQEESGQEIGEPMEDAPIGIEDERFEVEGGVEFMTAVKQENRKDTESREGKCEDVKGDAFFRPEVTEIDEEEIAEEEQPVVFGQDVRQGAGNLQGDAEKEKQRQGIFGLQQAEREGQEQGKLQVNPDVVGTRTQSTAASE